MMNFSLLLLLLHYSSLRCMWQQLLTNSQKKIRAHGNIEKHIRNTERGDQWLVYYWIRNDVMREVIRFNKSSFFGFVRFISFSICFVWLEILSSSQKKEKKYREQKRRRIGLWKKNLFWLLNEVRSVKHEKISVFVFWKVFVFFANFYIAWLDIHISWCRLVHSDSLKLWIQTFFYPRHKPHKHFNGFLFSNFIFFNLHNESQIII